MRPWPVALVLALAAALSGCGATPSGDPGGGARALSAFTAGPGSDPGSGPSSGASASAGTDHRFSLPTSAVVVPMAGVSWMQGTRLHVGGRAVDTGVRAQGYTLLPSGVLLYREGSLYFSDTQARAHRIATGVLGPDGVQLSPDGRYLAFLDDSYGPTDASGRHVYRLDVLDTRTGKQVLSSVKGLGDPSGSVAEQYAAAPPRLLAMGNRAAYVSGVGGNRRYGVDGSPPTRPASIPYADHGGAAVRTEKLATRYRIGPADGPLDGALSPSGRVALADTLHFRFAPFDARTGAPLELSPLEGTNNFALGGWLPGGDFWGFAFQGLNRSVRGTGQMAVCSLDEGECTAASGRITATRASPLLVGG